MTWPRVPVNANLSDWPRKIADAVNYLLRRDGVKDGLPTGGTAGQLLQKVDGVDYNAAWATPAASSVGLATLAFHSTAAGNATLTNQANAEQGLLNSARNEAYFDATDFAEVRVFSRVMVASASANDPRIYPQYWDGAAWVTVGTGLTTDSVSLAATGTAKSNWIALPVGAKADVIWRVAQNGGDAAADPQLGNTGLQFR